VTTATMTFRCNGTMVTAEYGLRLLKVTDGFEQCEGCGQDIASTGTWQRHPGKGLLVRCVVCGSEYQARRTP